VGKTNLLLRNLLRTPVLELEASKINLGKNLDKPTCDRHSQLFTKLLSRRIRDCEYNCPAEHPRHIFFMLLMLACCHCTRQLSKLHGFQTLWQMCLEA